MEVSNIKNLRGIIGKHIYNKSYVNDGIEEIELIVASSIGADLAMAFLTEAKMPVKHVFFDGGQFAQIEKLTRKIMVPFLYLAIKSLYWSKNTRK